MLLMMHLLVHMDYRVILYIRGQKYIVILLIVTNLLHFLQNVKIVGQTYMYGVIRHHN